MMDKATNTVISLSIEELDILLLCINALYAYDNDDGPFDDYKDVLSSNSLARLEEKLYGARNQ